MDSQWCLWLCSQYASKTRILQHDSTVLQQCRTGIWNSCVYKYLVWRAVNYGQCPVCFPRDQYEAAQIDGASGWQSFVHITLPHIRVVVGLLVVLRTIWVFNNFDTIYLITGGGPADLTATVPIYAYNVGWGLKQLGVSSAVTVLLLIFLLAVCMVYFKILDKWEKEGA